MSRPPDGRREGAADADAPDGGRHGAGPPADQRISTQDAGADDGTESDDRVIGTAFRVSLLALLALVAIAGAVLLWRWLGEGVREAPPADARVDVSALARPRAAPALPPLRYTDITTRAGIDFVHDNGATGERLLPETMGGGVAFLDYDNDGDQDLAFVDSGPWPHAQPARPAGAALRLYANDGAGRFRESTDAAGLSSLRAYGMGLAAGDYDGDGWVDLYLTAVGRNRLLRNTQGRYSETTEVAGVAGDDAGWSTGAAFFDADEDGDLDLFVVDYVRWSRAIDFEVDYRLTGIGRAYGPPTNFEGAQPALYRNEGEGRFVEVAAASGLHVLNPATGVAVGKGLAVLPLDIDGDARLDLFVANDTVRNFAFRNLGGGRFEETGVPWGLALDRNGQATGAMGVDAAAWRNDDALAIAVGNFANEMSSFYVDDDAGDGAVQFADQSIVAGIGAATRRALTFGLLFLDVDLDGRLDLLHANGHVEDDIARVQASQSHAQPAQLFWNCGRDCRTGFVEAPAADIGDLAVPIVGRGATYADIDADGDLDLALTQVGGRPLLLRNDSARGAHWLRVVLEGRAPNTGAIGAVLTLHAAGGTQLRQVMPTRSYLSQVELPVTFGLGSDVAIERLHIRWPDGSEQVLTELAPDRLHRIRQPDA